jgi:hypothetical protein
MTPVFQSTVDKGKGDCQRAAVASLFDLELEQVPHFRLYSSDTWWRVYYYFLIGIGYKFHGTSMAERHRDIGRRNYESVNGLFLATVPSRTIDGILHNVLIDEMGVVVHDPNPNKRWFGINVIESGELIHVDIIERVEKDESD